ncbi:PREDICTED: nose resistant to fluoxetine protein 6-like [Nicrophorus vespilloides]|uniref:Nose resistant to fluoxetine protein 6-like n=1 Tax=Nicrophorus vespilloides TaxID=110193 RepID=A0ABM1NGB1_NICVS|nr:PREDICTED: nose resistant to fluoxetine protein 6-like [Nicrophorus vespilloides]
MNVTALFDVLLQLSAICNTFDGIESEACRKQYKSLCTESPMTLMKMVDSGYRLPTGIMSGNILDFGNFDQCMSLHEEEPVHVYGKYCLSKVSYPPLTVLTALCIPDQCTIPDLNDVLNDTGVSLTSISCQDSGIKEEWTTGDWVMIGFFCFVALVIVASTIYDIVIYNFDRYPYHDSLIVFSMFTNFNKLTKITKNPEHMHCLDGIRAISMAWVIAGHRYASFGSPLVPIHNRVDAEEWLNSTQSFYIQGARVSVDTFFFLSAFLVSYLFFKGLKKNPLTIKKVPLFYLHRLLRIFPAMAVVYFVHLTIFKHFNSGPLWPEMFDFLQKSCVKHWWSFFLYVQNYVNFEDMCIIPTWYLSADMQMFLISPFILIPLGYLYEKKGKWFTYICLAVLVVFTIVVPLLANIYRDNIKFNEYETHARISVYMIGICFGFYLFDTDKKKLKIDTSTNVFIWALMLFLMTLIIVEYPSIYSVPIDIFNFDLFVSFTRPIWCFGLCWIIHSCITGSGGFVNWILSKPLWQILARLSYSMYLLHMTVQMISSGAIQNATHFSDYNTMYLWCGDFMFTVLASIFWVLAFESPMIGIEKLIFGKGKPKQRLENQ